MSSEAKAGSTLDILLRSPTTASERLLVREVKRLRAELAASADRMVWERKVRIKMELRVLSLLASTGGAS